MLAARGDRSLVFLEFCIGVISYATVALHEYVRTFDDDVTQYIHISTRRTFLRPSSSTTMFSLRRLPAQTIAVPSTRLFSSSLPLNANRALIYSQTGSPSSVLSSRTYPNLPPPPPNTLNLRLLLAPINPSDINVIEGVYPAKPAPASFPGDLSLSKSENGEDLFVGGNEGLAEVVESGEVGGKGQGEGEGERFEKGEWVILTKPQSGTWRSGVNVGVEDVVRIGREEGLSEVHAATITVRSFVVVSEFFVSFCSVAESDFIFTGFWGDVMLGELSDGV